MTRPVTYIEINSPDLPATQAFMASVFGWDARPFAAPDYLVAPCGDAPGIDAGLLASRDGRPRTVPVVRVDDLAAVLDSVTSNGGAVVVEPFAVPGVGRACYITDRAGVLVGLHAYDADG